MMSVILTAVNNPGRGQAGINRVARNFPSYYSKLCETQTMFLYRTRL